MRLLSLFSTLAFIAGFHGAFCQDRKSSFRSFDEPWVTDSASTMLIPYRYDASLFSSDKMKSWGNYYANYIVYHFNSDSYATLFPDDTYIQAPEPYSYSYSRGSEPRHRNISKSWVFYLVKNKDHNGNGKIDERDPFILYASDTRGENLKPITPESENVVSFVRYEKFGFILLTVQRDSNHDGEFQLNDNDHYLVRVNLSDLSLGNKIEYRNR
ncbi:hypothetical protein [Chryseolinea soli]|uniref:Uncharacterized protein n=1 Tax=Chryseolinea soli TaxID=2321403 RepID=A0A385SJW6_9BACT|nr:hypothetical protein [Chryseolinea soli]AYB31539.1 hypothetical protein D4L85_13580 [Chryseolinea soli]